MKEFKLVRAFVCGALFAFSIVAMLLVATTVTSTVLARIVIGAVAIGAGLAGSFSGVMSHGNFLHRLARIPAFVGGWIAFELMLAKLLKALPSIEARLNETLRLHQPAVEDLMWPPGVVGLAIGFVLYLYLKHRAAKPAQTP